MSDAARVPALPFALGLSGLVPFWALALAKATGWPHTLPAGEIDGMLATYAATILSFLGGIRWGASLGVPDQRVIATDYIFGVTPQLKDAVLKRLQDQLGLRPPQAAGMDTMACVEAAGRGEMRTAVCLGGNLFGSNPDASFASRALSNLDAIAYLSTTLNTGHAWGTGKETLILPVLPRDEREPCGVGRPDRLLEAGGSAAVVDYLPEAAELVGGRVMQARAYQKPVE